MGASTWRVWQKNKALHEANTRQSNLTTNEVLNWEWVGWKNKRTTAVRSFLSKNLIKVSLFSIIPRQKSVGLSNIPFLTLAHRAMPGLPIQLSKHGTSHVRHPVRLPPQPLTFMVSNTRVVTAGNCCEQAKTYLPPRYRGRASGWHVLTHTDVFQYSHISLLGCSYMLILAWNDLNKNESWQQPASVPWLLLSTLIARESEHSMCTPPCAFTPMRELPSPKYFYYHLWKRGRHWGCHQLLLQQLLIPHHTGQCCRYLLGTWQCFKYQTWAFEISLARDMLWHLPSPPVMDTA